MRKIRNIFINIVLLVASVGVTLGASEWLYRKAIFGNSPAFQKYRVPLLYAQDWDENFWKLAQTWGKIRPIKTHVMLGWNFKCWAKTYFHPQVQNLKGRRPVLLYGDSFGQCIDSTNCFEDYLNNDTAFNKKYFFINYGTGAHGVDQIYTLFKNSFYHYDNPIVIFSFLTNDMGRSILTFREGEKPIYKIQKDGTLFLDTSRYLPSNVAYLKKYPPTINSYLWRKFLYSKTNFLPDWLTYRLTGEATNWERVRELNEAILSDAVRLLRQSKTDFMFLSFQESKDYLIPEKDNLRLSFIRQFFTKNHLQYIWAKDVIKDGTNLQDSIAIRKYFIYHNDHPTSYFNYLLASEMKKRILLEQYEKYNVSQKNSAFKIKGQRSYFYANRLDSVLNIIKSDSLLIKQSRETAIAKNISVDQAVTDFAIWTLWNPEQK